MQDDLTLHSRISISGLVVKTIVGLAFVGFGYHYLSQALAVAEPDTTQVLFGGIFLLIGLSTLASFVGVRKWEVHPDRVVIKNLLNSVQHDFPRSSLQSWNETYRSRSNRGRTYTLHLFTARQSYRLSSSEMSNYKALRAALTNGLPRNEEARERHNKRFTWGVIGIVAVPVVYLAWMYVQNREGPLGPADLTHFLTEYGLFLLPILLVGFLLIRFRRS